MTPEMLKHTFRVAGGNTNRIKLLIRGHEHIFACHTYNKKAIAYTLPQIGLEDERDKSLLIEVDGPKLKSWGVQELTEGEKGYALSKKRSLTTPSTQDQDVT